MNEFRKALLLVIIQNLKADGVKFGQDPHTLSMSQVAALRDWADAVRYKGSSESSLGQGRLFYVYLSKLEV